MKTEEEKRKVLVLRSQGLSIAKITEETGFAKQTIVDILRDDRELLSTLKAIELDEYICERKLTKAARLEFLSSVAEGVQKELSTRLTPYGALRTDQLVKLFLDVQKAIREETEEVQLLSQVEVELTKDDRETPFLKTDPVKEYY